MKLLSKYGIFGRGALLSGMIVAALAAPPFFRAGCENPVAPEVNPEYTYTAEADSNGLENLVQVVDLPASELESWKSQYLTQDDGKLDRSELGTMAEYFFFNNAHQFSNFGPNFAPSKGEYSVVDCNLNNPNYSEAVINWDGGKYTFKVSKDLTSASLYENK